MTSLFLTSFMNDVPLCGIANATLTEGKIIAAILLSKWTLRDVSPYRHQMFVQGVDITCTIVARC